MDERATYECVYAGMHECMCILMKRYASVPMRMYVCNECCAKISAFQICTHVSIRSHIHSYNRTHARTCTPTCASCWFKTC